MLPLEGIHILDLTRLLPGPFCTMLLGDLGAEVIKIEQPGTGDYIRQMFPGMYYATNRNKKSVVVDMKVDEGKQVIYKLAKHSDVVLESFRPGVVEKLKVGYEDLKRIKPDIIYGSVTGYGQTGPYRLRSGHDLNYLSSAGAMSVPAKVGQSPTRSGLPVSDLCASMFATVAVLTALIYRDKTGKGQYLDVSMSDSILSWMASRLGEYMLTGEEPAQEGWEHVAAANDVFETSDGKKLSIAAIEAHFWEGFCKAIDRQDLLSDSRFNTRENNQKPENKLLLSQLMQKELLKKTRVEWIALFEEYDVPVASVASPAEVMANPQFISRGMIAETFIPSLARAIKQISFPVIMSEMPRDVRTPPPALGEHTEEVLRNLGFDLESINSLRTKGVIS